MVSAESFVGAEDEGDGLNDKRHQIAGLAPALQRHLVTLLNIDTNLTANDVPRRELSLHVGQETWQSLGCLGLPDELDVVAFETRLKELWIATLRSHLGQLIAPGWLVTLIVPVVKDCHCYVSVLRCLLKEDLRKDRHLEEEEIERAHHAALDHNRRSLGWFAHKAA